MGYGFSNTCRTGLSPRRRGVFSCLSLSNDQRGQATFGRGRGLREPRIAGTNLNRRGGFLRQGGERGSLQQDREAAPRTQRSLIPAKPPELSGWEIAAFYRPVIQVGGDVYGWLRMRDGRTLFWIADATGHGAAAALLTTLAKLLFHHASVENDAPAEIMRVVDRDFRSILGARSFMTAMCVALNPKTGAGCIVGAGHPPLLVARHDGQTESIASTSPPLGLVAGSSFTETPLQLSGGDLFLLYTDGLYGAGEGEERRLAPELVAKQLIDAPGDYQSLLQIILS